MSCDFDEVINRHHTDCLKYDFAQRFGKPEDILPLWVADMDFQAPTMVIEALSEKSRHGIFGYSESGEDYFEAVKSWFIRYFQWTVKPEWLIKTPGIVNAICTAIRALTREGDAILIQQPVYYPFSEAVKVNARKLIVNQLVFSQEKYSIDFQDFEDQIRLNEVKLFILCNPHNPVGRVWTRDELFGMGRICLKYGVKVISDEIHADFVYPGYRHLVFADLEPAFADISITCTAPSKTFNLAGLQISNIFIPNQPIRQLFKQEITKSGLGHLNIMGLVACKAAYSGGHQWLLDLKIYLARNLDWIRAFLRERLPQIQLIEPEGTYLVWLDFSGLGKSDAELDDLIVQKARLWLDAGTIFGAGGEGFQRVNIACPRATLEKAFTQLERAIKNGC